MMGGTLNDDLEPVDGSVITTAPGGLSKESSFDFSRANSANNSDDNSGFNGGEGLKNRQPQFESPKKKPNDRILPSHIWLIDLKKPKKYKLTKMQVNETQL